MRKEVILAIFVGLILGLFITYGVYQAQQSLDNTDQTSTILEETPSPSPGDVNPNQLVILSPEDEIIQSDTTIKVSGTTLPDIYVVVFVNNEETILTTDVNGSFSTEAELEKGSNIITTISIDEDGQESRVERTIIVSDIDLLDDEATKSATQT